MLCPLKINLNNHYISEPVGLGENQTDSTPSRTATGRYTDIFYQNGLCFTIIITCHILGQTHMNNFELCEHCQLLSKLSEDCQGCLHDETQATTDVQYLEDHTPVSQWITPAELGNAFGFTARHIIRLSAKENNRIVRRNIDGRWYILRCSFTKYLDRT